VKKKKLLKLIRKLKRSDLGRVLKLLDEAKTPTSFIQIAISDRVRALNVLEEFDNERWRQDREWGGPEHDDQHTAEEWADYIEKQSHRLRKLGELHGGWGEMQPHEVEAGISALVKIGALAAAAYESALRLRRTR
jgi:hypothetical protein